MADDKIEVEGKIVAVLPGTMFRVELPNKHVVASTYFGKTSETLYQDYCRGHGENGNEHL